MVTAVQAYSCCSNPKRSEKSRKRMVPDKHIPILCGTTVVSTSVTTTPRMCSLLQRSKKALFSACNKVPWCPPQGSIESVQPLVLPVHSHRHITNTLKREHDEKSSESGITPPKCVYIYPRLHGWMHINKCFRHTSEKQEEKMASHHVHCTVLEYSM